MGCSPKITSTSESTQEMLAAFKAGLPGLLETLNKEVLPTGKAQTEADAALAPEQAATQYGVASEFLPKYAQLGNELNALQSTGNVASDTAALSAAAKSGLVDTAMGLEHKVDPEYYKTRETTASGIAKLLGSINPEGLTGSESAEINRNLARSGTGAPSASRAITNAQTFGSKLDAKKELFGKALNSATAALPSLKTNFDPYKVATGKDSRGNAALGAFQTAGANFGQNAFNTGNQFLGETSAAQLAKNQQNFEAPTGLDKAGKALGMVAQVAGMVAT